MNIKQALERLEAIADAKKKADNLSTAINRRDSKAPKGVITQVYPGGQLGDHYGLYCVIDADLLQDAINKTAERYAAEAAKLQPVIDMAEAALKGVLATGDSK